ncbi:MAG: Crp/Fnr family transcriptional regulator [Chloroflexi bacterium]|nr:Crp/Fnr family transcriptional regulator [Chloroflexota bacterium]
MLEMVADLSLSQYDRGEMVLWERESCDGLCIVRRGSVKLFKLSPQGRELIIKVFSEGDSFNEVPTFDGGVNPVSIAALEQCEIWNVDAEAIRSSILKHAEVAQTTILNLSQNLRMLVTKIEELSFYQVTNRLARLINTLDQERLLNDHQQSLTNDDMAARLGTVREVVGRSLKELERSGAILVNRRKIEIANENRLLEWPRLPCED